MERKDNPQAPRSVFQPKFNNSVSWLGLVNSKPRMGLIAPISNIYNPYSVSSPGDLRSFVDWFGHHFHNA